MIKIGFWILTCVDKFWCKEISVWWLSCSPWTLHWINNCNWKINNSKQYLGSNPPLPPWTNSGRARMGGAGVNYCKHFFNNCFVGHFLNELFKFSGKILTFHFKNDCKIQYPSFSQKYLISDFKDTCICTFEII